MKHKHAELIKAWADGAEIEVKINGEFESVKRPSWHEQAEYREKPGPKPDISGGYMNERLKELAEHAGFTKTFARSWLWLAEDEELEHFAELIRADEREACAITAWSIGLDFYLKNHDIREVGFREIGSACATAIRQRGEK